MGQDRTPEQSRAARCIRPINDMPNCSLDLLRGAWDLVDEAMCFDPDSKYARLEDLCIDKQIIRSYLEAIPESGRSAAEKNVVRPLRKWALKLAGEALTGRMKKESRIWSCARWLWRRSGHGGEDADAIDEETIRVMLTIPTSVTDEFRSCVAAVGAQSDGRVDIRPDPDRSGPRRGHGVLFSLPDAVDPLDAGTADSEFTLMLHPFPATSIESCAEVAGQMTHRSAVRFIVSCDRLIEENYELTEEVAGSLAPVKRFYSPEKHKRFLYAGCNCVIDLHDH